MFFLGRSKAHREGVGVFLALIKTRIDLNGLDKKRVNKYETSASISLFIDKKLLYN